MNHNVLSELVSKLNKTAYDIFEKSVQLAHRNSNQSVNLEHFLYIFLTEHKQTSKILIDHGTDITDCVYKINNQIVRLTKENEKTPSLSTNIILLLKEGWLHASIDERNQSITPINLLQAIISSVHLLQICSIYIPQLEQITLQKTIQHKKNLSASKKNKIHHSELEKYTTNLNQKAIEGKLNSALGREKEIHQMINILQRKKQNNPILIGEPGVGKTAIVEGLAVKIIENQVPDILKNTIILTLNMASLMSGASVKGEFERRLNSLISELQSQEQPTILFIDEAHTLIGTGNAAGGLDSANLLKPALARGELKTIAATTLNEYKQYLEKDSALTRRFQPIYINEPSDEQALSMLRGLQPLLEKHHKVIIKEETLLAAIQLSRRYICDRFLPDKAISILDTACAKNALQKQTSPYILIHTKNKLEALELQVKQYNKNKLIEQNSSYEHQLEAQIKQLKKDIKRINNEHKKEQDLITKLERCLSENKTTKIQQKRFDKLSNQLNTLQEKHCHIPFIISKRSIENVITDWTGIPLERLTTDMNAKLIHLKKDLKQQVIKQDYATDIIMQAMTQSMLNLQDPEKPIGVFLFAGPSGVGKTHTANTLAELFFGTNEHVTILNMSEFKEPHKVALLLGAPPGYVGFGEGGLLTEAVRRQPYHLVLIDEIEKAHPDIHEVFYQIFDKGSAKDSQGKQVSFKNTIFILTTNIGSELIQRNSQENAETLRYHVQKELLQHFKPAFLGRLTTVPFKPLDQESAIAIIKSKLKQICERAQSYHQHEIIIDDKTIQSILKASDYTLTGAREFDRIINQLITPKITEEILHQYDTKDSILKQKNTN
jgi:type VI secretion system protein VasG